jgi:hypothetical protein
LQLDRKLRALDGKVLQLLIFFCQRLRSILHRTIQIASQAGKMRRHILKIADIDGSAFAVDLFALRDHLQSKVDYLNDLLARLRAAITSAMIVALDVRALSLIKQVNCCT